MEILPPRSIASIATFATKRFAGFGGHAHRWTLPAAFFLPPRPTPIRSFHCTSLSKSASKDDLESSSDDTFQYATSYHAPVMPNECILGLLGCDRCRSPDDDSSSTVSSVDSKPLIFVDGTLGGGGHSSAILERLGPGDIVFGCDVDPSALSTASRRLRRYTAAEGRKLDPSLPLFLPVQSNFRDLIDVLPDVRHPVTGELILEPLDDDAPSSNGNGDGGVDQADFVGVDGMLLDLGVSSHQIDNPDRGFAFMKDGPLDMRMWNGDWSTYDDDAAARLDDVSADEENEVGDGPSSPPSPSYGLTAADVCNEFEESELSRILRKYGDEPRARKIAGAIVARRPLRTTGDLMEAVSSVTPEFAKKGRRMGRTATLARVFQSLRIVVNEEDRALADVLEESAPALVRRGGRLVVLSYHSMEDRATKRVMRDGSVEGPRGRARFERDVYGNIIDDTRPWKPMGKRRKATDEEVNVNSRSRSATLRVARRV